jgi:hypothetical protein
VQNPEVASLLIEQRTEEMDHQWRIRVRMKAIPPDPEISAEDFADEPVAH